MDEQIFSEKDIPRIQISNLRRIVEQLRINLYTLQERAAHYGSFDVPLHLKNDIDEAIKRLRDAEAEHHKLQSGVDAVL
jgi:hypothetical protein